MSPSKENCRAMLNTLEKISDAMSQEFRTKHSHQLLSLRDFLEAAAKRLPTQAAIDKDKQRKRQTA